MKIKMKKSKILKLNKSLLDADIDVKCPACNFNFKNSKDLTRCKCIISSKLTTYYSNHNQLLMIYFNLNDHEWGFYKNYNNNNSFLKKIDFTIPKSDDSFIIPESIEIDLNSLEGFLSSMQSLISSLIFI